MVLLRNTSNAPRGEVTLQPRWPSPDTPPQGGGRGSTESPTTPTTPLPTTPHVVPDAAVAGVPYTEADAALDRWLDAVNEARDVEVPFSLDAADAEIAVLTEKGGRGSVWATVTMYDAPPPPPPPPLRRAPFGESHPIQDEMLPYVRDMLDHALHGYFTLAFPHDDLLPISGRHSDSFSGVGITLLDSLDMLALMGRHRTFRRAARWVEANLSLTTQVSTASAFEVNIRALGGLLAAHYMYEEGAVPVVREHHDYDSGLLRMAQELGTRLLGAFATPTGLPYRIVNLGQAHGASHWSPSDTSTADAGTYLLEFSALSRMTGDAKFAMAARSALQTLHDMRSAPMWMMQYSLDVVLAEWRQPLLASIGACVDSAIEYSVKDHVLSGESSEWRDFETDRRAASAWLRTGGFYGTFTEGTHLAFGRSAEGLAAFYPGSMLLGGHHAEAMEGVWAAHGLLKHRGVVVESTDLHSGTASGASYRLRPEHIESIYYLYRATRDPAYLVMGREFAIGLQLRTRIPLGLAVLRQSTLPHERADMEDYMESFVIAETLKYLYLLFDEASPVHRRAPSDGAAAEGVRSGVDWVFTTEAHVFPNTWEGWGLDSEEKVRSGLRESGAPVSPAAYMFADASVKTGPAMSASERAGVARIHEARESWLQALNFQAAVSPNMSQREVRESRYHAWRSVAEGSYGRLRDAHEQRRAVWLTRASPAARLRNVRGLQCATYQRLLRQRDTKARRQEIRGAASLLRELDAACADHGPPLVSPRDAQAAPSFASAEHVNPVHRHLLRSVADGAHSYFCDVSHRGGVGLLSKVVYRAAAPPHSY